MNNKEEFAIKTLIEYIGADPNTPELKNTPKRVLKSYKELFNGYEKNPREILKLMPNNDYNESIIVKDIEYYSACEHHMQPFFGTAHIAYIPDKHITGLSKIPRLVECFAHRLQNQERLTQQIADTIYTELNAKGVAVQISGKHLCMCSRGVKQTHSETITQKFLGTYKENPHLRQEFFQQI